MKKAMENIGILTISTIVFFALAFGLNEALMYVWDETFMLDWIISDSDLLGWIALILAFATASELGSFIKERCVEC